MFDYQCDKITDEINELRHDLIEDGGIVDELKKIRELLVFISRSLTPISNLAAAELESRNKKGAE